MLAAQPVGDLARQPPEGLARRIDQEPVAPDLGRLCTHSRHQDLSEREWPTAVKKERECYRSPFALTSPSLFQ